MTRIIPRLDIKGPNLVKGVHMEGLRVLGNPYSFAEHYSENGADEILYVDIVASLYGRNTLNHLISKTARNINVPLTVGGGIRSCKDIERLLISGADKVTINTAAIKSPEFVEEAVKEFGSSTININIECKFTQKDYYCFIDNGRELTEVKMVDWVRNLVDYNVGEITVTSIDKEGTGNGFDYPLIEKIYPLVRCNLNVHGGAGCINDILKLLKDFELSSVICSSIFHYFILQKNILDYKHENEGNTKYLLSNNVRKKLECCSIQELKSILTENKVLIRQ